MTADEVVEEIQKDRILYRNSNGGVTLTGGEPLEQASFSIDIARRAQNERIHTVMETSAAASWNVLKEVLAYFDLVLCDLKAIDDELTRRFTGSPAADVLENICRMDEMEKPVIIRIPLIPQITDTPQNLRDLIRFLDNLSHIRKVDLLPYHDLGSEKYFRLNRDYPLSVTALHTTEFLQEIELLFSSHGFETTLRGDRI
jgi:pyruvate formate lyase activating enzyme